MTEFWPEEWDEYARKASRRRSLAPSGATCQGVWGREIRRRRSLTQCVRRAACLGLRVSEKQMSARKKVLGIKPLGFGGSVVISDTTTLIPL